MSSGPTRNLTWRHKPVGPIPEKDDYLSLVFAIKRDPASLAIIEAAKQKPIYKGRGRPQKAWAPC